jgi:hypothetical protein
MHAVWPARLQDAESLAHRLSPALLAPIATAYHGIVQRLAEVHTGYIAAACMPPAAARRKSSGATRPPQASAIVLRCF